MQTFDQHLVDLVRAREVEFSVARAASTDPVEFELAMQTGDGPGAGRPWSARRCRRVVVASAVTPMSSPTVEGLSTGFDFPGR